MRRFIFAAIIALHGVCAEAKDDSQDTRTRDEKIAELRARVTAAEMQLSEALTQARADFDIWMDKLPEGPQLPSLDDEVARFPFDVLDENGTPNAIHESAPAHGYKAPQLADGKLGKAAAFDGENGFHAPLPERLPPDDAFTFTLWVRASAPTDRAVILYHAPASNTRGPSHELLLEAGHIAFALRDEALGLSVKVITIAKLDGWTHLAVTCDGSSRADGIRIFLNGRPAELKPAPDAPREAAARCAGSQITIGGDGFKGGRIDELRIFSRALSPLEIATAAGLDDYTKAIQSIPHPSPAQRRAIFEFYVAASHHDSLVARAALRKARSDLRQLAGAADAR